MEALSVFGISDGRVINGLARITEKTESLDKPFLGAKPIEDNVYFHDGRGLDIGIKPRPVIAALGGRKTAECLAHKVLNSEGCNEFFGIEGNVDSLKYLGVWSGDWPDGNFYIESQCI